MAAATVSTSCEPKSRPHRVTLNRIILDDENSAHPLRELRLELLENLSQVFTLHRLQHVADGAERERRLRVVGGRNHMNRNMTGANVALQLIEHPKAGMVRQTDVQHDCARNEFLGKRERLGRAAGDKTFELHLVGKIAKDASETLVVLDDQKDAPLPAQPLTIVVELSIRSSSRG